MIFEHILPVHSGIEGRAFSFVIKASQVQCFGRTNLTDALNLATCELGQLTRVRAIVIATDGALNSRKSSLNAAKRTKAAGIDIIAIGTENADHDFLASLATRSDLASKVRAEHLRSGITEAT